MAFDPQNTKRLAVSVCFLFFVCASIGLIDGAEYMENKGKVCRVLFC